MPPNIEYEVQKEFGSAKAAEGSSEAPKEMIVFLRTKDNVKFRDEFFNVISQLLERLDKLPLSFKVSSEMFPVEFEFVV